jgi:hypothetical protein
MPSLKHPVRTGKKKSGAKKKKSWDSVVKGAQGKGVRGQSIQGSRDRSKDRKENQKEKVR